MWITIGVISYFLVGLFASCYIAKYDNPKYRPDYFSYFLVLLFWPFLILLIPMSLLTKLWDYFYESNN